MISKITLDLQEKSYEIIIGNNILSEINKFIDNKNYTKKIVITDKNLYKIYKDHFTKNTQIDDFIIIDPGEKSKSFDNLKKICNEILQKNIDRKSLIIALGGGVVGDLAGFCAAILLRGIDFIQVPTSLLAMVDSSVGGKTAINSDFGKNLIGSFYQPKLVLCDIDFLKSLPEREFKSGYAEIVKYGLIYDREFFNFLEQNHVKIFNRDNVTLAHIIQRSCEIKAQIVAQDEKENNLRALLNFGHTFGHILEAETNYSDELLHGEAVVIGMLMACQMSLELGYIDIKIYDKIYNYLLQANFELNLKNIRKSWDVNNLIKHLFKDKKIENNELTFILINDIGSGIIEKKVSLEIFLKTIKKFLD